MGYRVSWSGIYGFGSPRMFTCRSGSGKKKKIQKQILSLFFKKCLLNSCRASSYLFFFLNGTFGTGVLEQGKALVLHVLDLI